MLEALRIQDALQEIRRVHLFAILRAAFEFEQVGTLSVLRHVHVFDSGDGPLDKAIEAEDLEAELALVGNAEPLITALLLLLLKAT